ncbi:S1 RNA-binding domain-containing protein [Laribacter hongkongensis]|uniref:S1 RNA-binding domain-containing protein n=1 Tax=Laribacter hongkongensis TaxID=168471 RepID=UPI001EFE572D|nr:S1 RNA-binding domain-containing protein [Laribacter hongkongensis]MCG9076988.1 S1 RNA-binding domain-containing protein [Laribacter hongkongensis]
MTSILSKYEGQENRRALGGIYALAGFDYQLRLYLADLVESLAGQGRDLDKAGGVFLEALSDLAKTEDGSLVCIQVKRTLTRETLKDAAAEVVAIDRFLAKHYPDSRAEVKFELVASKGDASLQWSDVPGTHSAYSTIQALIQQRRLLSPRIEPDPWWRAIVAAWKQLKDPYGFLRFALERALSREPTAADAQRIRDDICERFAQARHAPDLPGQLLTPADFQLAAHPSASLEIGREVTLARLRDQQYMPRPHRLDALYPKLIERKDLSQRDLRSEARVFWLSGRSGVGKSVLLLQAVERLVDDGWRVLWLKGQAELLEPALKVIADAPAEWRPDFIAIDDLYDRDARSRLDLGRLGEFIDERGHQAWPMILTCGPAEFAESFREDATYRGFDLHLETIETIAADEAEEIEAWYRQRTGKGSQRGPAFSQASQEDNGLFVSLAVELAHGNLEAFAQRFSNRVRLIDGLDEALRLPLALNRLYLRAPYDWLTDNDREKLATLNSEGDFSLLEAGAEGQIVRLTHPHLADALYRALRKPANPEAFTNDLVAVFRRALAEHDTGLVSQLLRVFSAFDEGLASERLRIADRPRLARECARIWAREHTQLALDADGLANAATSWACWSTTMPCVAEVLGNDLLDTALACLSAAYKVWPGCWDRLAGCYPKRDELFAWAAKHLADPLKISHPTWSYAWERCLQDDPSHHAEWYDMGLDWLQRHLRRPDWHIVWKKLLPGGGAPDWKTDPVLILGLRRLHAESDGPDWAYVVEDLYALAKPPCPQTGELATLARAWLAGREDRAEWSHVWRALLAQHEGLPEGLTLGDLLRLGAQWLSGREYRAEWTHIWRALLAQREGLPEGLTLGDLLRLGAQWLSGREDRAEWTHVWQALLAQHEGLPEGLTLGDLLRLGAQWLSGREDRAEWTHVWQALLAQREGLPEGQALGDLLRLGAQWLDGRENRAEWAHIWQDLLAQHEGLPEGLALGDLLRLGAQWLAGREDRAEWAHIWQALLAQHEGLPEGLALDDLLRLGAQWLAGREDRAEWAHVWQALLAQHEGLPEELALGDLLRLGAQWLAGREDRAEWAHVWQALLAQHEDLPEELALGDLLRLGAQWLDGRENSEEWGFVCEALLDQQFQAVTFIEHAAAWLKRTGAKPEWPLLAAKFIIAAPLHAASLEFARALTARIKACANKAHWLKTVNLVGALPTNIELPSEVLDWLQTLHARTELPAWAEARHCRNEGLPVKGRVIAVHDKTTTVELDIGLVAVWPSDRDGIRRKKGLERSFFVRQLVPDRDRVIVCTEKPVTLEVNQIYQGSVITHLKFGLLVNIVGQTGLLHRSHCPDWENLVRRYPVGSQIAVEILAVNDKGPELRYVDSELTSNRGLAVGEIYEACVTGVADFGVFLRVGAYSGLLHISQLPPNTDIPKQYSPGQNHSIQVIKIRDDGKISFTLPPPSA